MENDNKVGARIRFVDGGNIEFALLHEQEDGQVIEVAAVLTPDAALGLAQALVVAVQHTVGETDDTE